MGVINQSWRDTMALLGGQFTKEEHTAGWPESLRPERIAELQRPFKWWPVKDREHEKVALCRAYKDGLNDALTSGELTGTATTVTVTPKPPQVQRRNEFASSEWLGEFGRFGLTGVRNGRITSQPIPRAREVTTYTVTAPAFAAWLAAQSETPSVHIQAWFDAVGVAGAAQAAPVAVVPANDGPAPLTTGDAAHCLNGLRWPEKGWKNTLGEVKTRKWLQECVTMRGQQGFIEARWNPVLLCAYLVRQGHVTARNVRAKFQTIDLLSPWLDAWKTYEADNLDTP